MQKTKILSAMAAVLMAAMSAGFTSCSKDNKEPEPVPDFLQVSTSQWFARVVLSDGTNILYYLKFNTDGSYSYETENGTINGMYKIYQSEKVTSFKWINVYGDEVINPQEATLYKMLVSGSNDFDQLWVYYASGGFLVLHSYSGNELVKISLDFHRV